MTDYIAVFFYSFETYFCRIYYPIEKMKNEYVMNFKYVFSKLNTK